MKVTRSGPAAFEVEFESEEELRAEYAANLSMNGLRLVTTEGVPLYSKLSLVVAGPSGLLVELAATVVAPLPEGVALMIEGSTEGLLERLLPERKEAPAEVTPEDEEASPVNLWDRIRAMTQTEKRLLAVKADRSVRALLAQDNDPMVLQALLKNPRFTADEVIRIAKSPFLTYQVVDVIVQTGQWMANLDVRVALIHNAKTPPSFAMRILPTLPESELKVIARGAATSMALKQAALRRLQNRA